jgi:hypothetical protein
MFGLFGTFETTIDFMKLWLFLVFEISNGQLDFKLTSNFSREEFEIDASWLLYDIYCLVLYIKSLKKFIYNLEGKMLINLASNYFYGLLPI